MAVNRNRPTTDLFRPLLDDVFGQEWGGRMAGMGVMRAPSADVMETREEIRVSLELPGMRPDDVEVNLENNVLTITGEKREERKEDDREDRWHLSERRYGRFTRSFVLPRDVDQDRIHASFENGVLTVAIPKSEKAKARRIEISDGGGRQRIETGKSK
jgi:HSP20 family protein